MIRHNVDSSSIRSIGHEGTTLEVEFKNGSVYQYSGVDLSTYQKLRISKSIGSSLHSDIIKGGYPTKKMTE